MMFFFFLIIKSCATPKELQFDGVCYYTESDNTFFCLGPPNMKIDTYTLTRTNAHTQCEEPTGMKTYLPLRYMSPREAQPLVDAAE